MPPTKANRSFSWSHRTKEIIAIMLSGNFNLPEWFPLKWSMSMDNEEICHRMPSNLPQHRDRNFRSEIILQADKVCARNRFSFGSAESSNIHWFTVKRGEDWERKIASLSLAWAFWSKRIVIRWNLSIPFLEFWPQKNFAFKLVERFDIIRAEIGFSRTRFV